ncbi:dTDP-4-dehydrorhamnose reductase family protein [Enorma phocaeensis]|uniref:dTDP-4-dehydrorhamnose reductase family protein n=1 Tax=Enorma phocaeensis TaxID=1871019 RepID=UPI002353DD8A|nr:SDR family oxidoreductase [Enorma phocaeensis]
MRFLVFGATGMAGHMVSLYLQEQGYEVIGFSRRPAVFLRAHIEGDAYDRASVAEVIGSCKPDIVVNCIGALVAECEAHHDQAVYLNTYFPHYLAALCDERATRVFQLSTDCVFRGNTGPYSENALPDALDFYGRAKALGELIDDRNLTLRQSIIGPDCSPEGTGLLNWFLKQRESLNGWTRAIWTGCTTLELAKAIEACALANYTGLINMVPDGPGISKHDLLSLFNRYIRNKTVDIIPDSSFSCDKSLVRKRDDSPFIPQGYEKQIVELSVWIRTHRELYSHYIV